MPRKGPPPKRRVLPDPVYHSETAAKFMNKLLMDGKKSVAERIFYGALNLVEKRMERNALEVFEQALRNVQPAIEVKPRRVGGSTYQVPVEVRADRKQALAFRWLISYARRRGGRTMQEKLAGEIMDAANNTGQAVKRKEDTHRMAEANKAFAHYRW
ncbi:MAG TPA: 30S ribosomal protein S7 [Armatimonadota bacterium]|nr:30S ribosomal protein S7 [Armatimonadota bacterium]